MTIRVRFSHPVTGARSAVTCASEAEAKGLRERIRVYRLLLRTGGISRDEVIDRLARRSTLTVREGHALWSKGAARSTRENSGHALAGILATVADEPIEALDADRMTRWVAAVEPSYADSSVLWAWRVLCAIVRGAIERRKLERVPWGDWRPPRRLDPTPRPHEIVTTPEDAARLLAAARELDVESRQPVGNLEARLALCLLAGLRVGELSGLRWSDLDGVRRRVTIARQHDGEGVKTRTATIRAAAQLFEILERYRVRLAELPYLYAPHGPVFPAYWTSRRASSPQHRHDDAIEPDDVRRVVIHAGLPNPERWTVHALRASFVCFELASSGSLAHAMARGRHRSIKAVQHYARHLIDLAPPEPAWSLPEAPPRPKVLP